MATDAQTSNEVPVSDYRAVPKSETQLSPETLFAPTCMIWCMVLALGSIALIMALWAFTETLSMFSAG